MADLNGKDAVNFGQQGCLVVLEVLVVLWEDLHHLVFLLFGDCLYHQQVVVAEEEEAAAGAHGLLGFLDLIDILLQIQSLLNPISVQPVVQSQTFKNSMSVRADLDIQCAAFLKPLLLCFHLCFHFDCP